MKKYFVLLMALFLTLSGFSQTSRDLITLKNGGKVRTEPISSALDTILGKNAAIIILKKIDAMYYHIKIINSDNKIINTKYAYINSLWLTYDPNPPTQSRTIFETYIIMYGIPNSKSAYNDGDYHSQTYIWYCANGKYRSVDFEQNEYGWKMKSEFESDCIGK